MGKVAPCSQFDSATNRCRSGWPGVSGACFGIIHPGCENCGEGRTTPPCMKEEVPAHFIRDDGKPIFWEDTRHGQ